MTNFNVLNEDPFLSRLNWHRITVCEVTSRNSDRVRELERAAFVITFQLASTCEIVLVLQLMFTRL